MRYSIKTWVFLLSQQCKDKTNVKQTAIDNYKTPIYRHIVAKIHRYTNITTK